MLQHEAALTKAEETLEEDNAAFDKFLKESDEKVQQAMSRADAEMKAKQEKVCSQGALTANITLMPEWQICDDVRRMFNC